MNLKIAPLWVIILLFSVSIYPQQNEKEIYLLFDTIVGFENTVLLNGIENIDPQKTINSKNKFLFPKSGFSIGSLTYDGQYFPEVPMRFNVVDDEILLRVPINKINTIFKLITKKIDSFIIKDHSFIKVNDISDTDELSGFYEQLYANRKFKLLKKYIKNGDKQLDKSFVYYEYNLRKPSYHFWYNGNYFSADSRRNFYEVFPSLKKEIRKFYSERKNLRKQNPDEFMQLLLTEITNLLNLEE